MTTSVVIDASVAVELSLHPEHATLAPRLQSCALLAPAIVHVESTNVLRRIAAHHRLAARHADAVFTALHTLPIETVDWSLLADRVWRLRANLTAYDASYVALAEFADAPLLTLDRRLASAPGLRCRVEVYG